MPWRAVRDDGFQSTCGIPLVLALGDDVFVTPTGRFMPGCWRRRVQGAVSVLLPRNNRGSIRLFAADAGLRLLVLVALLVLLVLLS